MVIDIYANTQNISQYNNIRIPYVAVCGANQDQGNRCIESILVMAYTEGLSGPSQAGVQPTAETCTNKERDDEWGYCDIVFSDEEIDKMSGNLNMIRLVFFTTQNHPTYIGLSSLEITNEEGAPPTIIVLPRTNLSPQSTMYLLSFILIVLAFVVYRKKFGYELSEDMLKKAGNSGIDLGYKVYKSTIGSPKVAGIMPSKTYEKMVSKEVDNS